MMGINRVLLTDVKLDANMLGAVIVLVDIK